MLFRSACDPISRCSRRGRKHRGALSGPQPPELPGGIGGLGGEACRGIGVSQFQPGVALQRMAPQLLPMRGEGGGIGGRHRGDQRPVVVRAVLTISWPRPVVLLNTLKLLPAKAPLPVRVPALVQLPSRRLMESPALPVISSWRR